ncbi:glycosyltransferase [Massilia yuzhufengensis]|uniref:Glycosyltransferase involved in cell wall bisynthesis n=1 Tax=Massilia yuzhufengensis TaxID=1164594 RepID=A0A1I1R2H1_9BURK|nr:glycosyltransferase [Massilia yuzhufengensis]SFD26328.1 Glycosyltransferase involved in cell wall bisynthesis [Massilia yuzhufengensis]
MPTLIVFCHLRWDFVFQRPQHLMTRLAEHYRILFVEEPVYGEGQAYMKKTAAAPNITVCQPHTPIHAPGFHDDQIPTLQAMLADLVPEGEQPVVWFYTPMALPLLQGLNPSKIIYDCMDELAMFKNSPKQLLQRESALLNMADVVFTGGPSLYQSKRDRHANAHCFSSSVDAKHFRQAQDADISHPDQAHIPHPRLGFYGVIDERFDVDLVSSMADAHPEWQIVLVGPVVKIDPATLPKQANVHYMGQRTYDELPKFLAGWDVCLLPFAMNDSTKFISPTKVLEYMAAELPAVSTPITDVKVPYGDVVAVAETTEEFIAACERQLALGDGERQAMAKRMREVVAGTSWDLTASRMHELITSAVPGHNARRPAPADAVMAEVLPVKVNAVPVAKTA